jgi:WD40 repeat protein
VLRGHTKWVWSVAFAPDGKTLATGGWDNSVRLWDIAGPEPAEKAVLSGYADRVWSVAFAPDGQALATGSQDGDVQLWDLTGQEPKERVQLRRHQGAVRSLAFLPSGRVLVSAGEDGQVILWEATTGAVIWDWQLPGAVSGVAAALDGKHLATANSNGTVYVLRLSLIPRFPW